MAGQRPEPGRGPGGAPGRPDGACGEGTIRVRACLAVVQGRRILLVPHYLTEARETHWLVPGGRVHFGESLEAAATREFAEETGLQGRSVGLLDVSEAALPGPPGHIVTITYRGEVTGGTLTPEQHARFGTKEARWFSWPELQSQRYHPPTAVAKALSES